MFSRARCRRLPQLIAQLVALWGGIAALSALATDELTLDNVTPPAANLAAEPLAERYSLTAATQFLDQASLHWTKSRQCFACHTNFVYLIVRPEVSANTEAHRQVRQALEEMVEKRWQTEGPRWDAEVVMAAAVLAMNDAATTGKLQTTTRTALTRMWSVQRPDGGFDWLKCGWPPMESDDDYGIAIAALALAAAPEQYVASEEAQLGLKRLKQYLEKNPPPTLHHQAMLLWAESFGIELLSAEQRRQCLDSIRQLQRPDGGWAVASFGNWQRADDSAQDLTTSDGYATGLALLVLQQTDREHSTAEIERGVRWLKSNQRASGRWYTRSLNKDSKHFLSHAGTAFAVLALTACGQQ